MLLLKRMKASSRGYLSSNRSVALSAAPEAHFEGAHFPVRPFDEQGSQQ